MTSFQKGLARVSAIVGIRVKFRDEIRLPSGLTLLPQAHFLDFGAPRGTLIFHSHDEYREAKEELLKVGYSYSEFGTPTEDNFDPDSLRETLAEWGWSGTQTSKPSWVERFKSDWAEED